MHAIGTDHGIRARAGAVAKRKRELPRVPVESSELLAEVDDLGRHRGLDGGEKLGAVKIQEGCPEFRYRFLAQLELARDLAGIPFPAQPHLGSVCDLLQVLLDTQAAQDLDGV